MICLKTFENKTLQSFNNESDMWINFVNENYKYSQEKSKYNDFKGKCEAFDLPSFHPYWELMIRLRNRKYLFEITKKYKECLLDKNKIKFFFNKDSNILDVEVKIKRLKQKIYI